MLTETVAGTVIETETEGKNLFFDVLYGVCPRVIRNG